MPIQIARDRSPADALLLKSRLLRRWFVAAIAVATTAAAIAVRFSGPADGATAAEGVAPPRGLLAVTHPVSNPPTPEKIELGRQLFFDPVLSRDRTLSCASCHDPQRGYSIGERFARGVGGALGRVHPPTLVNVAYNMMQFWDGRIGSVGGDDSLEQQALEPIRDPREMDLDPEVAAQRLNADPGYRRQFEAVFKGPATPELIAKAIATFERTLLFGDSPYDRYTAGDKKAMSEAAIRGRDLFFWKATCSACHRGPNLTDNAFHPGIAVRTVDLADRGTADDADQGRFAVSGDEAHRGFFKTPTLREVARRSPYMHNGSLATLEAVVARYNEGGVDTHYWPPNRRPLLEQLMALPSKQREHYLKNAAPQLRAGFPLFLTPEEQQDLVTFLREGLTSSSSP
ncbi:MAG: cytochrome-c peroxidase [Planctomycetaceae bacterium]|nr:cytochrome-c peroxidase [Planctomycetaceae bacterium]